MLCQKQMFHLTHADSNCTSSELNVGSHYFCLVSKIYKRLQFAVDVKAIFFSHEILFVSHVIEIDFSSASVSVSECVNYFATLASG